MKQTICTSQYSRGLAHNHHRYNPSPVELAPSSQEDNPQERYDDLPHPEVHTYHFRMEMARAIWRNYRHG